MIFILLPALILAPILILLVSLYIRAANKKNLSLMIAEFNRKKVERKEESAEYLEIRGKIERGEIREGMTFEQFTTVWKANFSPRIKAEIVSEFGYKARFEYFAWNTSGGESLGEILLYFQNGILGKIQVVELPGLRGAPDDDTAKDAAEGKA